MWKTYFSEHFISFEDINNKNQHDVFFNLLRVAVWFYKTCNLFTISNGIVFQQVLFTKCHKDQYKFIKKKYCLLFVCDLKDLRQCMYFTSNSKKQAQNLKLCRFG